MFNSYVSHCPKVSLWDISHPQPAPSAKGSHSIHALGLRPFKSFVPGLSVTRNIGENCGKHRVNNINEYKYLWIKWWNDWLNSGIWEQLKENWEINDVKICPTLIRGDMIELNWVNVINKYIDRCLSMKWWNHKMMTSSTTVAKNTSRKSSEYGSIPMENGNSSHLNLVEPWGGELMIWRTKLGF